MNEMKLSFLKKYLDDTNNKLSSISLDGLLSSDDAVRKKLINLTIKKKTLEEIFNDGYINHRTGIISILQEDIKGHINSSNWEEVSKVSAILAVLNDSKKNIKIINDVIEQSQDNKENYLLIKPKQMFNEEVDEKVANTPNNHLSEEEYSKMWGRKYRTPISIEIIDSSNAESVKIEIKNWRDAIQHLCKQYQEKFPNNKKVQSYAQKTLDRKSIISTLASPDANDFNNALKKFSNYTTYDLKQNKETFTVNVKYIKN